MAAVTHDQLSIRFLSSIAKIRPETWDELALPLTTPLLEWNWLHQLEASGSIAPAAGWQPCHLTIWSGKRLVGAAPLYIKSHSAGEFVFDHFWSQAASQIGVGYYPKLVGMSPVTPAVGYRFLIAKDQNQKSITRFMLAAIDRFCAKHGLSGANFLFVDPAWGAELSAFGYIAWRHQSFVWKNRDYTDFDDFLKDFKTNQRRNIKRELRQMTRQGIYLEMFAGDQIPSDFIPQMYRFYSRTNSQFGPFGCHYLTPEFFHGIYENYRKRLLFVAAFGRSRPRIPLAMAMLLTKADRIIGRYWGSDARIKDLHFNTCYYLPIEWAIQNNIRHFDPGAGSFHKIRRGFTAVPNYSFHRFFNPRMVHLLRTHIAPINRLAQNRIDELNAHRPVKNAVTDAESV